MRWVYSFIVFAVSGLAAHYFVLTSIPGFIMSKAHQTFERGGLPMNTWVASPRQTPQTQRIVRPSPDLAYSVCRFDTTNGPIFISAPVGDGYGSLSIFNDQTDNVFVADLSPGSNFAGIEVRRPAENTTPDALALDGRGVALVRRLAPIQSEYDAAAGLVPGAICQPIEQ
ncbi:MAG: DUF1254 domain-containing protein [Henriciella sp.]